MVVADMFPLAGHSVPDTTKPEPLPQGAMYSKYPGRCKFCGVQFEVGVTAIQPAAKALHDKPTAGGKPGHTRPQFARPATGWVHFPECPPKDERPVKDDSAPDLTGLQAMLAKGIVNGLKNPKAIFTMPDGREIRVVMPSQSIHPGRCYVSSNEKDWTLRSKYGWLDNGTSNIRDIAIREFLIEVNKNPLDAVILYGKRTGSCSFCARELTDERSVNVGYGPICASKYSLPWGE